MTLWHIPSPKYMYEQGQWLLIHEIFSQHGSLNYNFDKRQRSKTEEAMLLEYTLRIFCASKKPSLTNIVVRQDDTIEWDIKSQDSNHPGCIKNHKIVGRMMIHLDQSLKTDGGIDDGISNNLNQNHQNHLIWLHHNYLLWLMTLSQLLTSQTCITTLLLEYLITLVNFVSIILSNVSLDTFFWIPIRSTKWNLEWKLYNYSGFKSWLKKV